MSTYFRNLSIDSTSSSFAFAEDLGYAVDRAQGVLSLVADVLAQDPEETNYFAVHAVLRELADMRDSIDAFIGLHPDLAREGSEAGDAE
jgi:hypothetical protein